jgi:hypothetical protein
LFLEMSSDVFSDFLLGDLGLVGVEHIDDLQGTNKTSKSNKAIYHLGSVQESVILNF